MKVHRKIDGKNAFSIFIWLLLMSVLLSCLYAPINASQQPPFSRINASSIGQIDFSNVLKHIEFFSNLGSRVTGYEGFYNAAKYIKNYWGDVLGLNVIEEKFRIASPIVKKYSLKVEIPNEGVIKTEAYPLWPNHVNPCPYKSPENGDRLVYVEQGLPEDFDGLNVDGAFVLMDFNNRWYWKNVALFNGKGVIFLEPEDTIGTQAVQKVFSVPINFPRLYITGEAASLLKEKILKHGELKIWINSLMVWENVEAANIIAVIEGTDPNLMKEVAIIGAYYDSWSIVPQLSPGATDSMGISFLMEMARLLKLNPPKRTVWLVAFAGHYQALAGAREFIEDHFNELREKIKMMISLDLASDSDIVAAYATGVMYGYNRPRDLIQYYDGWMRQISAWLDEIESETKETVHFIDGVRWVRPPWIANSPPFEPFLKYFEAEVFTEACYGGGLGFVTTNAFRKYQYTPFDTFSRIKPENLRRQIAILWPVIYNSVNIDSIPYPLYPRRFGAVDHGLVTATLQLGVYNKTINMFNDYANENAVIFVSVGPTMGSTTSIVAVGLQPAAYVGASQSIIVQGVTVGLFAAPPTVGSGGTITTASLSAPLGFTVVLKPDENGRVELKGIKPLTGVDAQGYVLDPETGKIICATDTGPFGTGIFRLGGLFGQPSSAAAPTLTPGLGGISYLMEAGAWARAFTVQVVHGHRYIPLFNASSIALLGFFDPLLLTGPQSLSVEILNFISHSYFVWRDVLSTWPEAMVFMEPNVPAEIVVRSQGKIIAVLNNATSFNPEGQGYKLPHGETLIVTVLDAIKNIFYLTNYRGGFLESKMSVNPKMLLFLSLMRQYMQLADDAAKSGAKGRFYSYSIAAWQYALSAYDASLSLLYDVVQTASFFFFVCVAFIIFVTRFIGKKITGGLKQILVILALFATANFVLSLIHPGYTISSNIWMLLNGLSVIFYVILLLYVIIDELNSALSSVSVSMLGFHRSDIERGTVLISALSMGIENLKKRPLRTMLSLSTIIITITAMTLFTTIGVMVFSYARPLGSAPYTGVLLKRPPQQLSMPISEIYTISLPDVMSINLTNFSAMPRAWIYPSGQSLFLSWGGNASGIRGIMAITVDEAQMLKGAIKPGKGFTFVPEIKYSVLMAESLAERLGQMLGYQIEPGKTKINIYGINMTVVGILDKDFATAILSKDLDQNSIVMPDPLSTGLTGLYSPLDLDTVIIVPYDFAMECLNVQPNAIRLSSESPQLSLASIFDKSFKMALTFPFEISYGVKDDVAGAVTKRDIYSLGGMENLLIPLLLSSLTILSMMLSAVYERRREIATLSTVGLSPSHIGAIFVMESIALAFLGSFLGYVIGAGVTSILWNLRMFPQSLVPNVSSGVIVIVMGIMMLATIISSIYPMMKASSLATPSLMRKWRIGSKPVGDQWSIELPFSATSDEASGLLCFISEYFEAFATERAGLFMLLSPIELTQKENAQVLKAHLQLSPFDAGIIQNLHIIAKMVSAEMYGFEILIERLHGVESLWTTANRSLIGEIRKQFLIWRALSSKEKKSYIEKAVARWMK